MLQSALILLGVLVFVLCIVAQWFWIEDLGTAWSFSFTQGIYFVLATGVTKVLIYPAAGGSGSLGIEFVFVVSIGLGLLAIWLLNLIVGLTLGFIRNRDYM